MEVRRLYVSWSRTEVGLGGGVRNILLSPSEKHDPLTSFGFLKHLDALPVMIEPGAFERFPIEVIQHTGQTFTSKLLAGHFTHAILIDQEGVERPFPIPPQPTETENRVTLAGRVVKR